jgi:AbrB family looped-hinge helix DNA binding protein
MRHISSYRAKVGPSGRLVIPAAQRHALGIREGDEVLIRLEDDELRISTLRHRVARAQALVRKHNKRGEALSQSLIRDRRAESAKE